MITKVLYLLLCQHTSPARSFTWHPDKFFNAIVFFIAFAISASAQEITIYYDGDWNKVSTVDSAVYYKRVAALDAYGHPVGRYTDYYMSGKIRMIGQYINGRRWGSFTSYYENGDYKETGSYKDGEYFIGSAWDEQGNSKVIDGDGECTHYYYNKQKKNEGSYKNGKKTGTWNYWYKNGKKKEKIQYKDGVENVIAAWNKDGKPLLDNGTGEYTGYHDNGVIRTTGMYRDGKREGEWKWWDEQARPSTISNYENGLRTGKSIFYSNTGRRETNYKNGLKDGESIGYNANDDNSFYELYRNDTLVFGQIGFMDGNELYTQVEKMPYPDYVPNDIFRDNLQYPKGAREEAFVCISFTVNKEGKVENVGVERSSGKKDFDDEAVRLYSLLPPWVPGEHDGKKVNVRIVWSFKFDLISHKID